jgi:hypothetical protein
MNRITEIALLTFGLCVLGQPASAQRSWVREQAIGVARQGTIAIHQPGADAQAVTSTTLSYAVAPTSNYAAVRFGMLDAGTGTFYPISTLPTLAFSIARDAQNRLVTLDFKGDLYRINPGNGKATRVGASGILGAGVASTGDGTLYALDVNNVLYRVNTETGAASLVGTTGIPPIDPNGSYAATFAADCTHLYYIQGIYSSYPVWGQFPMLWRINSQTATVELIGPITPPLPFFGSGFIDGKMFAYSFDETFRPGGPVAKVYQVDVTTGAASFVSNLNAPSIYGSVPLGEGNGKPCLVQ